MSVSLTALSLASAWAVPAFAQTSLDPPPQPDPAPTAIARLPSDDSTPTGPARTAAVPLMITLPPSETSNADTSVLYAASEDNRGTTVNERTRPDFDPAGLHLGGFTLLPAASVNAHYNTNVFAQPTAVGDVFTQVRVAALLRSDWQKNALSVDGFVDERAYAKYTSESGITYRGHAIGRFDIGTRDYLMLEASHELVFVQRGAVGEDIETRQALLQTRQPIRYHLTMVTPSVHKEFGRIALTAQTPIIRYDYLNSETRVGALLDQQFRDFTSYGLTAELTYALPSGVAFFVSGHGELRRFRVPPPVSRPIVRDENGIEILGGITGDITPLLRGRLGVGYIQADFKDPSIPTRGAASFDARLDYLLTDLTTINLTGRRYFQNVASVTTSAALATNVQLTIYHELLRNLIVSGGGGFQDADYIEIPGSTTVPANSRRFTGNVGAKWSLTPVWQVNGDVSYRSRSQASTNVPRDYSQFEFMLGVTLRR